MYTRDLQMISRFGFSSGTLVQKHARLDSKLPPGVRLTGTYAKWVRYASQICDCLLNCLLRLFPVLLRQETVIIKGKGDMF